MLSDLTDMLKSLELPTTYGHWASGQAPKLPYLVITENQPEDLAADNSHYYPIKSFDIELYFEKKDPNLETKIESFFSDQDIPYAVSEDYWIANEKFYQKSYSIELGE